VTRASPASGRRTWRQCAGRSTCSTPIKLGSSAGTESLTEWWVDGAILTDPVGNLSVTWDTQSATHDGGWLVYSTDGGVQWSAPVRATSLMLDVDELVESAGVGSGIADVAWQTPTPEGYATFPQTYSIRHGWLEKRAVRVSTGYGNSSV
jgi:hypothetical protein